MEYIEREALRDALYESDAITMRGVAILNRFPAADVVPVRHGWWIDMGDFISCSLCSATRMKEFLCDYGVARRLDVRTNYCPNCGADMRQDVKGEDND